MRRCGVSLRRWDGGLLPPDEELARSAARKNASDTHPDAAAVRFLPPDARMPASTGQIRRATVRRTDSAMRRSEAVLWQFLLMNFRRSQVLLHH